MRKASVRDLHIRTSELVREAAAGAVITIELRGQPMAELRPISPRLKNSRLPLLTNLWKRLPSVSGDRGRYLEEDR